MSKDPTTKRKRGGRKYGKFTAKSKSPKASKSKLSKEKTKSKANTILGDAYKNKEKNKGWKKWSE